MIDAGKLFIEIYWVAIEISIGSLRTVTYPMRSHALDACLNAVVEQLRCALVRQPRTSAVLAFLDKIYQVAKVLLSVLQWQVGNIAVSGAKCKCMLLTDS